MKISLLLFAGAVLCSGIMRADNIFSNYSGTGYGASGDALLVNYADGVAFTAPAAPRGYAYEVTDVQIAAYSTDTATQATISIYGSDPTNSDLPGNSPLDSVDVSLPTPPDTPPGTLTEVSLDPILESGDQYWVVVSYPETGNADWEFTDDSEDSGVAVQDSYGNWSLNTGYTQGAVEVDATLVPDAPEPGTFPALCSGLAGLIVLRRQRAKNDPVNCRVS